MAEQPRDLILNVNKFQKLIIFPVIIFCIIAGVMVYMTLEYNVRVSINPKESSILSFDAAKYREALPYMLILIAVMLVCIIGWVYYISNRIVGPHNRIIRELDAMIEGKSKGQLSVRKDDAMFAEIVDRINKLTN